MAITLTDIATISVGALSIILIVLTVIYIINNEKGGSKGNSEQKDTFAMAPDGVTVTSTGAITGPAIYTNYLTNGDSAKQLLPQAEKGVLNDRSNAVVGDTNNIKAFDGALQKQLKVQEIQNKANNGFQQIDDLKEISKNIAQDNGLKGVFKREGLATNKLVIDKYGTVGIIDQKYMPNRDRPKELRVVGTAICVPGFDFDATKALNSQGQGFCPTGGVMAIHSERHKRKTTSLNTVANASSKAEPEPQNLPTQLADNNIIAATTISPVNQDPQPSAEAQPTEVAPKSTAVVIEEPAE